MELVLEGGDHAEVAATATQTPEEVGVFGGARDQQGALRGDDIGGQEVVARQAVLPCQPAKAAAQGQAGNTGIGHGAPGCCQAESLSLTVEIPQVAPPSARAVRRIGSTRTLRRAARSIIRPPWHTALPGALWPPPRTEIRIV